MPLKILGWITIAAICRAAQPIQLTPQPQKFRTFYAPGDPQVPAALKEPAPPPPVGEMAAAAIASDGAVWYGTSQGAVRVDLKAGAHVARRGARRFEGRRRRASSVFRGEALPAG